MGSRFVVPTVATCVDLVVHLALAPDGRRRVEEVVVVPGRVESDVIWTEPIFTRIHGGLSEHELTLLVQSCRTVTTLDALDAVLRREGATLPTTEDGAAGTKAHPAAIELRLQSITLARVLAALRLPAGTVGDEKPSGRPKRSSGPRGVSGVRPAS